MLALPSLLTTEFVFSNYFNCRTFLTRATTLLSPSELCNAQRVLGVYSIVSTYS